VIRRLNKREQNGDWLPALLRKRLKLGPWDGGAILIDDCEESSVWRARKGYVRFVKENGLPEKYFMGMELVEKP